MSAVPIAIIQARLSSQRLPGKVLKEIQGRPLLDYVYQRVSQSRLLQNIVVATSDHSSDEPIFEYCLKQGMECYRGPLEDVAGRFSGALLNYDAPSFLRISADSPMMDPEIIDTAIRHFQTGCYDLVTNVFPRTFPKGQSVEIVGAELFNAAYEKMISTEDKEHVTRVFYQNAGQYRILNFTSEQNLSHLNLCIDTQEDFDRFEQSLRVTA